MAEKQTYTPAHAGGGWHPSQPPADDQHICAPAPRYGTQPMQANGMPQADGLPPAYGQPGQPSQPGFQSGPPPPPIIMVSAQICPVTGGPHAEKSRPGVIGLLIGIIFCPIGCIAVCFDQQRTCRNCNYVIEEAWGGC